jgi:eukaryotic-like serine/threonine-protein kinase
MTWLSDRAVERLQSAAERPDFSGTRYRLLEQIGRGGMGVVYEADDEALGRRVAVKVLAAELASSKEADRLRREARTVAGLEHPGIVPVHDVGELPDGRVYYAMKLVRGEPLDAWTARSPSRTDRLRAFLRVCEAVGFAHANGVLHRDLKPRNVMVGEFGAVLVMDWGLARSAGERPGAGSIAGTPGWMAPEQARGEEGAVDAASDTFGLGAILRFLVQEGGEPVPRPLQAIAEKAMSEARADRYATAGALAEEVTRFLDGRPVAAYRENAFEKAARWVSRNRPLVTIVAAYILMRAAVFFFFRR